MASDIKIPTECPWCSEELTREEIEHPVYRQGELICDECDTEHFQFSCCMCDEYEENEYQEAIGCLLVVAEPVDMFPSGRAYRGIYEITKHPYYRCGMLGGSDLFKKAVKKISPLPKGIDPGEFHCGYLCRPCAEKMKMEAQHGD